ncbi:golgin subfamily B member 1-like isoform X3 [Catharus ustulatus]|uniref:golgin subfamily B member 1-like isoform X3 n=1 Tax=Catharus ustulatus TaxID=91951 RepID=UPI00140CAD9C|nr:golgin subfamily B member 1-like isoform X3 [Catharus ustulatus]
MWKWGSGDDSPSKTAAPGPRDVGSTAVTDLTEQLTSTEQLLAQLKELVKEKDAELRSKDLQLKEEKESADAKLSKLKLQNKAKVASLTSQLEELKKQLPLAGGLEAKAEPKKASKDGDQENAAANRGKILVLRRRIEELESQIAQKNEELQKKDAELEAQRSRGADMDAMLAEKEKKLAERDAYIRDLQVACGSSDAANEIFLPNEELKNQLAAKESSLQNMEILVRNLTKKVGDSEEKCSLFQEQIESLKNIQNKEREHFQEKEATYMESVRTFQNLIQEKEKELEAQREKHEQELFRLAAKSDASADLEQLLKALKQKLHEKEEVMLGRTQVIDVLQKELDAKDQQLKEINESLKRLLSEKENLQSKLDAEKHVMRAQLKDMMEKHELEMTKVKAKYDAELHEIQEKHETELQEKDQALVQLQKQVAELSGGGQSNSKKVKDLESVTKEKMEDLEVQVKLKTEEASKSEAKFLKMKAWSKSRIKQLEDELKNFSSKNNDASALSNRVSELEVENEALQSKLQSLHEIRTQNEELLKKLELYEEQQRKLQADLDQVTKRAASQASESGSVDELQSQLLEWQENVPESEESRDQVREEKSAMALRMAQIEEEREAIVSGQQELEEELATIQGMGRLQQARRKGSQTSRKLQEEFPFDGKQCFQELNVTLDSTDSTEGENMGGWWPEYPSPNAGLRSVVEELELERNQLQEQILFLEERCQDLEDRFQLQGRMEALQNENERLQTQLTQLRSQQMRDVEKHQILISGLNEQLKGLSDRNSFLENSLGEREQKLVSTTEKLEQIEALRKLLQEKDILNKELGEKFAHVEQQLNEALKKCSVYEVENVEQKTAISDLTERVATLKEKTLKQDSMVESMQLDLDQTNEELDKLNSSHLEERSQLIQDLQKREREIDNLKEALAEKDKEMSVLSLNMAEYLEQVMILKHQVQCKEEEMRGLEEALSKDEREMHLLKEEQTADLRDASRKISVLSEESDTMRMELERVRAENEAKTKENKELIRQSTENNVTIKDLRSEIKANNVTYHNKLVECESQITLLKEQITKSSEKLQETEDKQRKEMEYLKSQLEESNVLKEQWNSLLKEKESKAQTLENELKSIKDSYNKLVLENAKKDEELAELSRKLTEHTDHEKTAKKELQEKQELIISLEQRLGALEKQNEETKLKLTGDLKAKETCCKELSDQLNEMHKQIKKWEIETQEKASANNHLQADLEGKQEILAEQVKTNENLKKTIGTMEKEKEQLIRENENLSKLLDVKECELLKKTQAVAELENKLSVSTAEYEKTLSVLNSDKNTLAKEIEQLSVVTKQKESSVAEQLGEKTKECNVLAEQLSESKEQIQQLHEQVQSLLIQLKEIRDEEIKKEEMLNNKLSECSGLIQELTHSKENNLLLQEKIQSITLDFETANRSLEEKNLQNDSLRKEMEESKLCVVELQNEIKNLKDEKTKLTQLIEERDLAVKSQGSELEKFQRQIFEKMEENTVLNNQVQLLSKEVDVLRHEKEDFSSLLSEKSHECACLQSEITSARHQAQTATLENEKLKADLETVNVTIISKSEEIAALTSHLSQQSHNILDLKDQIDSLLMEKENLKITFEEKETLLSEKEALIREVKDKVAGEKQYVEFIADLQNQIQALNLETNELRHAMQEKEDEFKRQAQELKLLKDKSEESDVLRVQLSENMEIISDLQSQLKNMTEQLSQLNNLIVQKDASLKQKIDECISLKAQLCEVQDSCVEQEKQLQLLASETEQLKVLVSEKESAINSISIFSENLKMQLQEKETECGVLKKQMVELQEMKETFQKEIEHQKNVIIERDQSLSEKESSLTENKSLLKTLEEKARKDEEKTHLISQLQSQVHELTQELQNSKELVREKENAFLSLQEKIEAQYELRTELNVALGQKEEVIAGLLDSLKKKDASIQLAESNVNTLSSEIDVLRSKLEESGTAMKNLTEEFQEKNEKLDNHQKKIDSLTVELDSLKNEYQKALDQINTQAQELQQKDLAGESLRVTCTEQAEKLECLKLEFNNVNSKSSQDCHDNALLINSLQCQVESLEKEKSLLKDDVGKLVAENTQLAASQTDLQKKLEDLREIHAKLETSENYARMQIDAVKLQMKTEKEKLQMQVSVKGEELSKLEFKCQTLEQSLLESENKWVTELDRANSQNNDLTEQLSSLESEMKSKDSEIQSLQQELDLIKEKLTQNLSPLLSSRLFWKEKAQISDSELQPTDSKTQLEKFSTLVTAIMRKETEGEHLQLALLEKQKEIDTMKNELRNMESLEKQKEVLQSDMEKMKGRYTSEMECLSKEMVSLKETLGKQECLLKEREESLAEMNEQVEFLQDKMNKSEEMVRTSQEKLQAEGKKVASLLEEVEEKDHLIKNLTSQVNQQKDLISGLSQQMKEKDSSVTQVMESLSNEMLNFSEERGALNAKLQDLEAVHNSSVAELNRVLQELGDCKKELEHNQVMLSSREAEFKDLMNEKEEMKCNLEKMGKEKDNLKKKLQAALIVRRDLMQKVGKLEKSGQEEIEKEQKKAEELMKQVDELTDKLKLIEGQNNDFESHLGTLKQQLIEKDAKISDLTKTLSSRASYLEELQDNITELNDVIAEKQNVCEQNLKSLGEKDCMLAHLQEEHSQLLLTLEEVKSELKKKEELLKNCSLEELGSSAGDRNECLNPNNDVNAMNQLQKEKEALEKELLVVKGDMKKFQQEREEHVKLAADFDEQKAHLEQLQQEHNALWEVLQTKCKQLGFNQLEGMELVPPKALLGGEQADPRNLESDKPGNKAQVASFEESENMITSVPSEDIELKELRSDYAKLQEEAEMLRKELRKILVEFIDDKEETISLNSLGQEKPCQGSLLEDLKHLQKKLKAHQTETTELKAVLERVNNEKKALLKKSEEDYRMSQEELQRSRIEAKQEVAGKNEEIEALRCSLMDLKEKHGLEKELLNKAIKEGQEETHHYKTAFEDMKSEKEELLSSLEKSNVELIKMKKEVEHFSEENKNLMAELHMLHEKAEMSKPVVLGKGLKEENRTEKKLGEVVSESNSLQGNLEGNVTPFQLSETDCSGKPKLREATECEIQKQMQTMEEPLAKPANLNDSKAQEQRAVTEERSRERLQRKLQAALISRKEALRENKYLKEQIDQLMLEREELVNKTGMLEHLLELGGEKQSSGAVAPLSGEESLASENARLLTENENLTAACESLKSTMESIVQEKEAFSFQLNTLKDSQTVELTGWKAKHSELKQEYESLLQAYENISSKVADMRQVIDLSRKEKQEAVQRLMEEQSEKEALQKHLQNLLNDHEVVKNQLKQLGESKKMEVEQLQSKAERQIREQEARMQEHQDRLCELTEQNHQLMEENEQLKQTSENLKQALEKIQNENDVLHNNITVTKAALGELQVQMEVYQNDTQSKISDALCENESLLKDINVLKDKLCEKEQAVLVLEQERKLISEKAQETEKSLLHKTHCLTELDMECKSLTQEIVSLNEKVKILKDDKCLLQEELENVQESSYKVKNEREFLETELLNHIKKVDHLTDKMKSAQVQNNLLLQQLEKLKAEKSNVVREKEEQQLHLVKMFEEKVKSAQRDNNGTKNKTKELQELLKEKQQEINQLQKDSIKFQELILDLERSVKLSQSKNEKFEKDLSNASEKLAESNDEILHLKGKLSAQMNLLDQSKREVDRLKDENLNWRKELQKKGDELQLQKRGYERELEFHLQQLKLLHKSEISNLEERHGALQREKDWAMSEVQGLQEEVSTKDSQNKQLQAELNATLAQLAAFTKCMSSLQDDRDRVITEMKSWEMQFKEAIQNKEKQLEESNKRIAALQDELKDKMTQIQELNIKYSVVEETKDELYLRQKSVDMQRYEELCRIKEENTLFFNRQQELESVLQSKEEALQALLKENNSLNHLIENSKSAGREIKALESNFTRQEQELQELLLEKEKMNAELQKQITISEQMKIMLNNKDKEISLLISSKGDEISDYLIQVQTQHRNQIKEYELQVSSLQMERQQAEESRQKLENELRNLQVKAEKAGQDKAAIASEIDAFKKSMSSLQNDRDDLFTRYKELEHLHQDVLNQRDSLLVGSASETNALKQELRVLLNRIDDLHSENAMLSAQLIKYREDLNQVLSLKDHQLKDLLKQKLECIKSLEHEKYDLQKQIKEMQLSSELQKGAAVALEHENKKLASKVRDLESLITSLNKEKLVSESGEKLLSSESIQKKESNGQPGGKLQKKVQELQKSRGRSADEEYSGTLLTLEDGDKPDSSVEKMLLEVQSQNSELRSQNEAFGKAMTALQNDRDRIIEDFKVLQSKYTSELKSERKKGDELAAELQGFKSHLMSILKENSLLHEAVLDAADQVTLAQVADDIGSVCRTLVSRELEVSRLSAECGNYAQQIEAFAKAMASLQDDRDKLLQELSHQKAKEGASLAAVEISKLKTKVDDLERALHQTKAFQAETEREITSYQNELAGLRMEKNLLLSESQALRNQCQITVAEKDRQIAELQRLQQDVLGQKSLPAGSSYPVKALETATLAGSADGADEIKRVLAEKNQLQTELQHCLQEMQQKDLHFQQINSKVVQSAEENAVLSAQLKTLSQTLRDNQLHYTDLQNRYLRLEREYQAMQVASFQGSVQDETRAEVPPGAPQERSGIIVEIDNMELNELRKRLAETEQQYESVQQSLSQLTETLAEERRRREAAEEALGLSEERSNRFEVGSYRPVPSDYTVQMEAEEEREALIINPSEHVVVRKMKGGALSLRRWLRGRSLYCSKLLTARAKSRYLFLTYLVTLHLLVLLCLTGVL